ncbi:MAG: ankyrin repeat domain-containing protein [Endomicrobiaceae bacterium]|jgi:ankyrin repeat protein|nr:ankyrin repeat domain-containing protein [Endomicrobiaceae bacterium]MDD3730366.1 ankyrin repeat domain-containing protein [Endomicrobiaceae bacterium]MDD4166275.1 ankyrin repeat domain-containing protein [Endomicrobiaceae bacterium]
MVKKSLLIVFACLMFGFVTLSFAEDNKSQCKSVADINSNPKHGVTPLISAVKKNNIEIAKMLIENGADVNAVGGSEKKTAIFFAVSDDNVEMAKMLISKGANLNVTDAYHETPLNIAVEKGNKKMINLLLGVKEEK